jgi:hypothetical protein
MKAWSQHPVFYEINTWVWLSELSRRYDKRIDLSCVPAPEWDALAAKRIDALWLMGVWRRSPTGIEISMRNQELCSEFKRVLPDFSPEDNVGSPYCVQGYVVDNHLGGREGLAIARRELRERGVRLILDFVPNHVAPDHPWTVEHPEYFIRGDAEDLRRDPASFVESAGNVFACGKDPYFPAWADVLQLNAFHPGLRQAAMATVNAIADQCDAVRCDMSMLLLNDIFERTWGGRAGTKPTEEYWPKIVQATKRDYPDFKFIAEAYWDLEWRLQQDGFDYTYDKRLYDRMEHGEVENVRLHLLADAAYQERMVRFIENHDEPRVRAVFSAGKGRAAAVAVLTLPGAKLVHEGQAEGKKVRLPVFLGRRPAETSEQDLAAFYARLMDLTARDAFRNGQWQPCERSGWPDNPTFNNLLSWCWRKDDERHFIVINFSDAPAQGRVRVAWNELRGQSWRLRDGLSGSIYDRSGNEIVEQGLYIELEPWQSHVFEVTAL